MRLELLGDAGEAAQVGEQHHRVGARVGGGQQRVAQLRVLEDLVGDPRRDVAAEGLPQDLFAPPDFSLELSRGRLPAHRSRSHEGLDMGPQRLVSRHWIPNEIILLRPRVPQVHEVSAPGAGRATALGRRAPRVG